VTARCMGISPSHSSAPTSWVEHRQTQPGLSPSRQRDDDDLRDAWCEACDAYLQSNGGEWIEDTVEVAGGITIICAECYRQREADARLAGQRTIRHG